MRPLEKLFKQFISIALPPTCIVCNVTLSANSPVGICPDCFGDLKPWDKQEPAMPEIPDVVDSFSAPFIYEDPISDLITRLKFGDQPHLAQALAKHITPLLPEGDFTLIPVPIHPSRLRSRKFNQSAELVKTLAKISGLSSNLTYLKRARKTPPQVGRSAAARRKLPQNVFSANETFFKNKRIILVDDVWTTGTTATACTKILKKAGASEVHVRTLAYVPPGTFGA